MKDRNIFIQMYRKDMYRRICTQYHKHFFARLFLQRNTNAADVNVIFGLDSRGR